MVTELKIRGVNDHLIACVGGLTGFPEGIIAIPRTPKCRNGGCGLWPGATQHGTANYVAFQAEGHYTFRNLA